MIHLVDVLEGEAESWVKRVSELLRHIELNIARADLYPFGDMLTNEMLLRLMDADECAVYRRARHGQEFVGTLLRSRSLGAIFVWQT